MRRLLRHSLWLQLALMLFCSCYFAILRVLWIDSRAPEPTPVEQLLERAHLTQLDDGSLELYVYSGPVPLDLVARLPQLRWLKVRSARQVDWREIGKLRGLESLTVYREMTADDLSHLADLPRLSRLELDGDLVAAGGLVQLRACPRLRQLKLFGPGVRPSVLIALQQGTTLKELTLYCERFEPDLLRAGARVDRLRLP